MVATDDGTRNVALVLLYYESVMLVMIILLSDMVQLQDTTANTNIAIGSYAMTQHTLV